MSGLDPLSPLHLFSAGDIIEGEYDWKGCEWAGHVRGRFLDGIFRFDWWWSRSSEKGNGYFEFKADVLSDEYGTSVQMLDGGWAFDHEEVDVLGSHPEELKGHVRKWVYLRNLERAQSDT